MDLEHRVQEIEERNARVEADKAWETSFTRVISITIVTYIIATITFVVIGNEHPYRNALVPTMGFLLSVQSFPFLKKLWIKYRS